MLLRISIKFFSLLTFILFVFNANATNYYLSNSGNDANSGTDPSSPWQTLNKLNSFKNLKAGDKVLFKRGDTFYGSITVSNSGTAGNPITFSAYGTGEKPVITGLTDLIGWAINGNVYSTSLTNFPNMIMVDGKMQPIGRYPKNAYKPIGTSTSTSITDNTLSGSSNYTRAEIVIRKERYILDRNTITSQIGSTINFASNGTGFNPQNGWGYFIQNCPNALTTLGDWYWSNSIFYIFLDGNTHSVHASTSTTLVTVSSKNYITFEGINFQGANTSNFNLSNCSNITIKNCAINSSGKNGVNGSSATYVTIDNCVFDQNINDGIYMDDNSANFTLTNTTISNTATIAGMGGSGSGQYNAVQAFGANTLIQYNKITNTGGGGISFAGNNSSVKNNYVDSFAYVKDDGGGIYTGKGGNDVNKTISGNIVLDGIGAGQGTPYTYKVFAEGIYCDDNENSITVSDNTISKCNDGIKIHNAHNITIRGNTSYNNNYQIDIDHDQSLTSAITGLNIRNNYFIAQNTGQYVVRFSTFDKDVKAFGTADSNYYARPIDDNHTFITHDPTIDSGNWYDMATQTLAQWQNYSGQDSNSNISPKTINDINDLKFEYNADKVSKKITLPCNYIDLTGKSYNGTIILGPYSSALLIKNGQITNKSIKANAGIDQIITLPINIVILSGNGIDTDGRVVTYLWTKISGPSAYNISNSSSAVTAVSGLTQGVYQFELKVTDDKGAIGKDTINITVNASPNILTSANAGADKTITLPANSVSLSGSSSYKYGSVSSYSWTKISGPSSYNIANSSTAFTTISGLVQGVYVFELKATDEKGAIE